MLRGAFRTVLSNSSRQPSSNAQSNDRDLGSDEEDYGQPPYTQIPPPNTENGSSTSSSNRSSSYSLGTEYTPRTKRRMKSYGAMLCQNLNIPTSLMLPFTELPSPAHMMIDLKASIIRLEKSQESSRVANKLKDEQFKNGLTERLWTILMSPDLTAYRTGLTEHIMSKIHDDPLIFGADQEVVDNMDGIRRLRKMVGRTLTKLRGIMKQKITKSICNRTNVVKLAKKLSPGGLAQTAAHWNRVAFLRACLMELEKLSPPPLANQQDNRAEGSSMGATPEGDNAPDSNDNLSGSGPNSNDSEGDGNLDGNLEEDSSNQYWIYVDTQLKKFREKAYEIATPEQPAEEVLRCAFNQTCIMDVQTFQGESTPLPRSNNTRALWQKGIEDLGIW